MSTILPYTPQYRDACLAIFHSNRPKFFTEDEIALFTRWLDERCEDNYFVLENDSEIIACGGVFYDEATNAAGLSWGMVHSMHHKKGFGKEFTRYRIELMRRLFPGALYQINTSQHTVAFYEKMGFHTVKMTPDGYAVGMDRYDMEARF